jgi:hypothetical protein
MSQPDPEQLDRLIRQYSEREKEAYDSAAALQDITRTRCSRGCSA